jgi:ELWxxDGT repeat protein
VNGTLFILTDHSQQSTALWRSNGTAAGTVRLKQFDPFTSAADITPINTMANVNGALVFALYPASSAPGVRDGAIWRSDGTTAGTVPINEQLYHGLFSTVACGKLYFTARSTDEGASPQDLELWQSDGTAAGTSQVQDIAPGAAGSEPRSLTVVGRQLFFSADDGASGRELWLLPIERASVPGPTPSIPLSHQLFLPHTQVDASC